MRPRPRERAARSTERLSQATAAVASRFVKQERGAEHAELIDSSRARPLSARTIHLVGLPAGLVGRHANGMF